MCCEKQHDPGDDADETGPVGKEQEYRTIYRRTPRLKATGAAARKLVLASRIDVTGA